MYDNLKVNKYGKCKKIAVCWKVKKKRKIKTIER